MDEANDAGWLLRQAHLAVHSLWIEAQGNGKRAAERSLNAALADIEKAMTHVAKAKAQGE